MTDVLEETERITDVMSFAATFTVIEDAVTNLEEVKLADEELAVLASFPEELRISLIARLQELVTLLDEARHDLAANLLVARTAE